MQDGVAARFERVEQHPGFAAVMARTLEVPASRRRDSVADEALDGRLAEGDIGVAFVHGQALVDFVRFDA